MEQTLEAQKTESLSGNFSIEQVEAEMLKMEQVDCPVSHHFGPGIYIREVTLPAGIIAIGHRQKKRHLNIMITGKVAVVEEGGVKVLTAPLIFNAEPGKKVGYVIETCVWQNVYATNETDIDMLEAEFLEKSSEWESHAEEVFDLESKMKESDREDFIQLISEYGFTEDQVRSQSEDESDQIPMPQEWSPVVSVRDSAIEGRGIFLSWPVDGGTILAPARVNGMRTPVGRYTNHSRNPNCDFVEFENGDVYIVAKHGISGCMGGSMGVELTIEYRQALAINGIERTKTCQA